jgi:glycosyltransferase involved in cell wall biosynthesis
MTAIKPSPLESRATPTTGVVFTTYNRPRDLERVLAGYARQTYGRFEIVIADDGSGDETRQCIERARKNWRLDIRHVWQEDLGFRKCRILNRAIAETSAEYLIITDGDCIPHPEFVAGHLSLARPGYFVSGGCVRLGEAASRAIAADDVLNGSVFDTRWLTTHGESSLNLRKLMLSAPPWHGVMNSITTTRPTWNGHNSSTWREEVLAVNGFDERLGYGGLDREFGERLERCGMHGIQARYSLICLHLDHPRPYREREIMAANLKIRRDNARQNVRRTRYGLGLAPQVPAERQISTGA